MSREICTKEGDAPTQPPVGLNWLMGGRLHTGMAPSGVSPSNPLLKVGARSDALQAPAHRKGGVLFIGGRCMECGGQKLLPPHLPILGA